VPVGSPPIRVKIGSEPFTTFRFGGTFLFPVIAATGVLAATLSAHDPAGFGVDVSAGLRGDESGRGWGVSRPGGVGSWLAEEAGERGDDFEQLGIDPGLLVGEVPGLVFGDGAAVLGLGGELADAGGHGRVNGGAARVASRG